jgi:hypothetical protein
LQRPRIDFPVERLLVDPFSILTSLSNFCSV